MLTIEKLERRDCPSTVFPAGIPVPISTGPMLAHPAPHNPLPTDVPGLNVGQTSPQPSDLVFFVQDQAIGYDVQGNKIVGLTTNGAGIWGYDWNGNALISPYAVLVLFDAKQITITDQNGTVFFNETFDGTQALYWTFLQGQLPSPGVYTLTVTDMSNGQAIGPAVTQVYVLPPPPTVQP